MNKKICYLGWYDPSFPRNSVIRQGFISSGYEISECRVPVSMNKFVRISSLMKMYMKSAGGYSAIFVPESNHLLMPFARILASVYRIPLIFDPLISFYDSYVNDRKTISEGSKLGNAYKLLDRLSLNIADIVLTDTSEHKKYFCTVFGLDDKKAFVIPVGADTNYFSPKDSEPPLQKVNHSFTVLFTGSFIPLHGVEYIIESAYKLRDYKNIQFKIIGNGQQYSQMHALSNNKGLKNIEFLGWVPFTQLRDHFQKADIVLGIFGNTEKAKRVVPTKVYEGLAVRKPVITGDSPAIREFFKPNEDIFVVPMANGYGLAEGIIGMYEDGHLRNQIAEKGNQVFNREFTPEAIGKKLSMVMETINI